MIPAIVIGQPVVVDGHFERAMNGRTGRIVRPATEGGCAGRFAYVALDPTGTERDPVEAFLPVAFLEPEGGLQLGLDLL